MNFTLFAIIVISFLTSIYFVYKNKFSSFSTKSSAKFQNAELVKTLLSLDDDSLDELFKLYKEKFGRGAAYYARRTFLKWKAGKVHPNRQTYERFFVHLPKVMSYDLKCEVLRKLMQEYCAKDAYELTVSPEDWEEKLKPLVKTIIAKTYTATLPKLIEEKLRWLAEDEMQIAQNILKNSQVHEAETAVSMLHQEIAEVEKLLENTKGNSLVTHQLKFPYGTINLKIKRR